MDKELLEFLELGTYEEKKKWLTVKEKKLIAEERMPWWNRSILNGYMTSNVPDWYLERQFEEILWSGQEEFDRRSREWELLNINKLIESREFNYYFEEGESVMLDEYVMSDDYKRVYFELIGKKATVTRCYSDFHAFGKGSSYEHDLEFDGAKIPKGIDGKTFMPMGYIPTYMLKRYEEK